MKAVIETYIVSLENVLERMSSKADIWTFLETGKTDK